MQAKPNIAPELASKTHLRMRISAERAARTAEGARHPDEFKKLSATLAHRFLSLPESREVARVAAYASIGGEPPTDQIRRELRRHHCEVWLPYAHSLGQLEWVLDLGERMTSGPMGIPVPDGEFLNVDLAAAQIIIVPALAVDKNGARLGRGAGYYDRALANVPRIWDGGPLRVALIYQEEFHENLPAEPHDEKVDVVITPSQVFRLPESQTTE